MAMAPETVDRLLDLWRLGRTAGEIAIDLGVTRSAALGQVDRARKRGVDLSHRAAALAPAPSPEEAKPATQAPTRARDATKGLAPRRVTEPALATIEPDPSLSGTGDVGASGAPAAIAALRLADCRWPLGDPRAAGFRFCCAPARPGKPYCGPHATIAADRAPRTGRLILPTRTARA